MSSVCVVTCTCVQLMNVAPGWSRSGGCHLEHVLFLQVTSKPHVAEQHKIIAGEKVSHCTCMQVVTEHVQVKCTDQPGAACQYCDPNQASILHEFFG